MVGLPEEYPSILSTGECENVGVFPSTWATLPCLMHFTCFFLPALHLLLKHNQFVFVRPADNESIVCVMVVITDRQSTNKDVPFVRS